MTVAHVNRIATVVPPHEIHGAFVSFAKTHLADERKRALFSRMAAKAGIERRYSVLSPSPSTGSDCVDGEGLYRRGAFPSTGERMRVFERHAADLAERAVAKLDLGYAALGRITHVVVTSCTGLYAPGIDSELAKRLSLSPSVERTMIAFMGCYAAVNALKLARHVVRSEPQARVLVVNLELCTLHLQETNDLEQVLSFLLFADGCAASIVSADPEGIALDRFHALTVPDTADLITWHIRDQGFDMHLGGRVPAAIARGLSEASSTITNGAPVGSIERWAVHPGGRSVLDAVAHGLGLEGASLVESRSVLAKFGNMSSATIMFVLEEILRAAAPGERGCGMSFGPGLTAETFLFHKA